MIIESIILSGTIIFVSTLRFVRKVIADSNELEIQADKECREQEIKTNAEVMKIAQQMSDYETLKKDPALCKARLQAIYEKRKIILYERNEWENDPESEGLSWWAEIKKLNIKLDQLAEEEKNIPLLEGVEEFRKSLHIQENNQSQAIRSSDKSKRDALERERKIMEGLISNSALASERDDARKRLKEITQELSNCKN